MYPVLTLGFSVFFSITGHRQLRPGQGERDAQRRLQGGQQGPSLFLLWLDLDLDLTLVFLLQEVAKDSDASLGTRASAAKDAASDKISETKDSASAEGHKQKASH